MIAVGRWVLVAFVTVCALVFGLVGPAYAEETVPIEEPTSAPALPSSPVPVEESQVPVGEFGASSAESTYSMTETETPLSAEPSPVPTGIEVPEGEIDKGDLAVIERDEFTTTYETSGGATVVQLSQDPLNVETEEGDWEEIDTAIHGNGDGWDVAAHPLDPQFADSANDPNAVTVSRDGHEVSFSLAGARRGSVAAPFWWWDDWDTLTYRGVLDDADLVYDVEPGEVKETLVLNRGSLTRFSGHQR